MSESVKESMNAIIGAAKEGEGDPNYKELYEESQRRLHTEQVESGRLKKVQDELAALRRENEELRAKKRDQELVGSLSESERGDTPEEFLNATAKMVGKGMDVVDARIRELKQMQEQDARAAKDRAQSALLSRIDAEFPGWRSSICHGGDKHQSWNSYLRHNAASVTEAIDNCDFDSVKWHVENFYTTVLGVPVPSARQSGASAPDPVSNGGGNPVIGDGIERGKTYTQEEYRALEQRAESARANRNFSEYHALTQELDSILAEGRVKG